MTQETRPRRLVDKTIFLSASVPVQERDERFRRIPDAPFQVEQAVISLARAVFSEGGRLVFGGHPSISPLVATVAGEYREPNVAESDKERAPAQVVIYQSEVFREIIPDDSRLLIDLGLATVRWTDPIGNEAFRTGAGSAHHQCPDSLREMRERMIKDTAPVAMVCVGGMEGVEEEARIFKELRTTFPVFTLECTGGAAALIRDELPSAFAIDREIERDIAERTTEGYSSETDYRSRKDDIAVHPYPLIMQTIVDRIVPPDDEPEGEPERDIDYV